MTVHRSVIERQDLPAEFITDHASSPHTQVERRRGIANELYAVMVTTKESFWTIVHNRFMARDLSRADVRDIIRLGLEEARGNYRMVAKLFNLEPRDYRRFLGFLRKHDCQVPFKPYRV